MGKKYSILTMRIKFGNAQMIGKITIVNQKLLKKNNSNDEKESQYEQQQISLTKLFEGKPKWEKSRDFVAMLQLVSNGIISISLINKETELKTCYSKSTLLVEPKFSKCLDIMLMLTPKYVSLKNSYE